MQLCDHWTACVGIPFRQGCLLYGVLGGHDILHDSMHRTLICPYTEGRHHRFIHWLVSWVWMFTSSACDQRGKAICTYSYFGTRSVCVFPLRNYAEPFDFRCTLPLQDLDAAFMRSVSCDLSSTGVPTSSSSAPNNSDTNNSPTLSLSGLLNSLDGVAAAEGW